MRPWPATDLALITAQTRGHARREHGEEPANLGSNATSGWGSYLAVPLTSGGGLLSGVKLKKEDQKLTLGSKVGLLPDHDQVHRQAQRGRRLSAQAALHHRLGAPARARRPSGCRDYAQALMQTEAYRVSRSARKKIETLFGDAKHNLALVRLRLRGLSGARDEFLLTAPPSRISNAWQCTPRGRRHSPRQRSPCPETQLNLLDRPPAASADRLRRPNTVQPVQSRTQISRPIRLPQQPRLWAATPPRCPA